MEANGPEEWRMLRYLGVDTQILPNDVPVSEIRELDGLILSGGAARVGLTGQLGNCAQYLSLEVPDSRDMRGPPIHGQTLWWRCREALSRNSVQQPFP